MSYDRVKILTLRVLGAVLFAISLACLVEYLAAGTATSKVFNERYYSYAEVLAAILPVLLAFNLESKRKWSALSLVATAMAWAAILATTSRAMLVSGAIGIVTFSLLSRIVRGSFENPRQWILVFASLTVITVAFLISLRSYEPSTIVQRFSGTEKWSAESARSRLMFWGMAIEGFRISPLIGIGADNYFANYKSLREGFSRRDPANTVLEISEDSIPERAHNEYLQILSELGIVGAALFSWLVFGVVYLAWVAYRTQGSLLAVGALSGMVAFLTASGASSYSFRFVGNGICFFFLLALAASELFGSTHQRTELGPSSFSRTFPVVGILVSMGMILFCVVRVESLRHMTNALNARDEITKFTEIEKAVAIDPAEPMFRFYYGGWLSKSGEYDRATPQLRLGIDNGLANSTSFFGLAATQLKNGREADAEETLTEALRVYPRSIFLRTAYSAFLKRAGRIVESEAEYEKAILVNEKQARSWQLAHDEGLERLVQVARVDDRYVSTFDLKPESAPLTLVQFQETAP